jgi:hypothetical protein
MRYEPEDKERLRALVGTGGVLEQESPDIAPNPIEHEEARVLGNPSS